MSLYSVEVTIVGRFRLDIEAESEEECRKIVEFRIKNDEHGFI